MGLLSSSGQLFLLCLKFVLRIVRNVHPHIQHDEHNRLALALALTCLDGVKDTFNRNPQGFTTELILG